MKKVSVLILYSFPPPFLPDGTPDQIGEESVRSRLQAVQDALIAFGFPLQLLEAKEDLPDLVQKILAAKPALVFNLCEEFFGQTRMEMNIAALLELLDIPFTGSSAFVLGLSQDKGKTKAILAYNNIPTPPYQVWQLGKDELLAGLRFPLIVKPLREDASLGIDNDSLVADGRSLKEQIQKIYRVYGEPVLIEEYIEGRELNVSIIGNKSPRVLPISEIDFSSLAPGLPKICGYAAKWMEDSHEFCHTVPRCPAELPPEIEKEVLRLSLEAYQIMECRDYGRVDIRLSQGGIPYVLEVNANPDISPDAGLIRSAKAAGFSYQEFIGHLVELALARSKSWRSSRKTKAVLAERKSRA